MKVELIFFLILETLQNHTANHAVKLSYAIYFDVFVMKATGFKARFSRLPLETFKQKRIYEFHILVIIREMKSLSGAALVILTNL